MQAGRGRGSAYTIAPPAPNLKQHTGGLPLHAAAGQDKHPRVALVLAQLGWVYSRTARVTFAEGLYRECAKILRLEQPARWQAQVRAVAAG